MGAPRYGQILAALIAAAVVSCASPAKATSGRDLLEWCLSKDDTLHTFCLLYISGFVHGAQMQPYLGKALCLPEHLTGEEAVSVYVRKLREIASGPGKSDPMAKMFFTQPPETSLAAALGMEFDCSK